VALSKEKKCNHFVRLTTIAFLAHATVWLIIAIHLEASFQRKISDQDLPKHDINHHTST
jgi:hypothetical protein